jgi:Flp pilus assembly protein TadD
MKRHIAMICLVAGLSAGLGCAGSKTTDSGPQVPKSDAVSLRKELAFSLAQHGEWAAAVKPLIALSKEHPDDPELQVLLGTVYREQGLFEQAEASFNTAIRLDPSRAAAYGGRGIVREVRGDKGDAALEDFRTAVRLDPQEGSYANNLGFALWARGRYQEAATALQQGLTHDPLSRRMRNNLGFVYGRLGQYDRAKREFEHGGTADEVENNLGFVYEQAGEVETACQHYREALLANPRLKAAFENSQRACERKSQ